MKLIKPSHRFLLSLYGIRALEALPFSPYFWKENPAMATTIRNTNDLNNTLITINVAAQTPLKLTSSNYLSWKLQFQTLFAGYDLLGYIDGSKPCPSATITDNNTTTPNPAHLLWVRQDQLILNAIIGSISPNIIPFVATAKTSKEAWITLANTYAKPSRGRIKQVKSQIRQMTRGSASITEFLQNIKARADELMLLGALYDEDDITDKILEAVGDDYKELARAVQARDTPITFEELHEKLLNFEASLNTSKPDTMFPITSHVTTRTNNNWRINNGTNQNSSNPNHNLGVTQNNNSTQRQQRPYLGYYQLCRIQGHTAKKCPSYKLQPVQSNNNHSSTPWQPKANYAATTNNNQTWLLNSGASHHVTADLENLSLHNPYRGGTQHRDNTFEGPS
ncbi:hypothetical protein AB3S75_016030 [Citrus x aurantiifolia]